MSEKYSGSCLCNQIRFEVDGFSSEAANCHCTMCRKFHGAAFGTLVGVSGLQWRQGEDLLSSYCSSNGAKRYFCKECGSSLGFLARDALDTDIELAISCFDQEIPVSIDAHIYLSSRASWHEINDVLPKFEHGRDDDAYPMKPE